MGAYSQPAELQSILERNMRDAPVPRPMETGVPGSRLLYRCMPIRPAGSQPVRSGSAGPAAGNQGRHPASRHRIYAETTELTDLYDKEPRIGTYYWRVRGMDAKGRPVGEWSLPEKVELEPSEQVPVGIFGDSISHGGGRLSFSPADLAYSYAHYMDVPAVNLSESGDTSEMMVERFERDVLPFGLKTLLIMGAATVSGTGRTRKK